MSIDAPPARLRDDRDFRRYWLARQISVAGSLTTAVALPVLVYRLTGSPALTALTTLMEALPYLVFGLFAGALADRWDRRRVMVTAEIINAVVLMTIPITWWSGHLAVWQVLVVGFISQSVFAFFDGANFGALPTLVGQKRVPEANAAIWGFGGALDLMVPLAVGGLLAVLHPAVLLVFDALSFLGSALLVASISRPLTGIRGERKPFRPGVIVGEVATGLRWLWKHPGVRSNTILGTLQNAGGAGFMAMFVPFADKILQVGSSGWRFGVLYAVWGVGGILAAALTPRLLRRMSPLRIVLVMLPLSALFGLITASMSHWAAAAAVLVCWGIAYQAVLMNSLSYRQLVTPDELQGRVNTAGRVLSWGLGWSIGSSAAGALASAYGVRTTLIASVSLIVVAAAFAWLSPLPRLAAAERPNRSVGTGETAGV